MKFRDLIDTYYNKYLMQNLDKIRQHPDFKVEYLTLEEILKSAGNLFLEEDFDNHYRKTQDIFLKNYYNNDKLSKEIIKFGQYWPMFFDYKDGKYSLFEGHHRLNAIMYSYKNNYWPKNRKIYSLSLINDNMDIFKCRKEYDKIAYSEEVNTILYDNNYTLSEPLRLSFVKNINPRIFKSIMENKDKFNVTHKSINNTLIYEMDVYNFQTFYVIYNSLTAEISSSLFLFYNKENMIYPNKIININLGE